MASNAQAKASGMERRYELLPQMRQYDRASLNWVPYVMFTNSVNVRSKEYNTDEHGFRYTRHGDGWLDYQGFIEQPGAKAVVCGGSTAFGVGATSDEMGLPSLLNGQTDTTWFNLAGRALNSTQELLLFTMFLPPVQRVLVFSGVNNLLTHLVSSHFSLPFGAFFGDDGFYNLKQLSRGEMMVRMIPGRVRQLFRRHGANGDALTPAAINARIEESLQVTSRDFQVWRALRDSLGFKITYMVQPFATATKKTISPEEAELFDILDAQQGPQWHSVYQHVGARYGSYALKVEEMCRENGIEFINGNDLLPDDGWLFCDRVHLTDDGNRAIANILQQELSI